MSNFSVEMYILYLNFYDTAKAYWKNMATSEEQF